MTPNPGALFAQIPLFIEMGRRAAKNVDMIIQPWPWDGVLDITSFVAYHGTDATVMMGFIRYAG
jgi:hypothetical protein